MPLESDPLDILLGPDGDIVIDTDLRLVNGLAAVAQLIQIRLQEFREDWFLDLDVGMPYYQEILGAKYNPETIRAAVRSELIAVPGVAEIITLQTEFNGTTRGVKINWEVRTEFGDTSGEVEI